MSVQIKSFNKDLENRAQKSFDQRYFKKQLKRLGIYRLKRSSYFSFFLQNSLLEISPNKYFDTSWYLMQNPEIRNSDQHPYLYYLAAGYKENKLPNNWISLEEVRTLRITTTYSPAEALHEGHKRAQYKILTKKIRMTNQTIKSFLEIMWHTHGDTFHRKKTICKIFLCTKPGKTYRSAYENYFRICSVIGLSGRSRRVLKTDAHNESGRYSISIPLTPLLSRYSERIECLELDQDVINDAMKFTKTPQNTHITQGSITRMSYDDGQFDCILDFSTIDHCTLDEANLALNEYARVSTTDPLIVIVVWTSPEHFFDESNLQTFFSKTDFTRNVKKYFKVYFEKSLLNVEHGNLILFVCSKTDSDE
jgi:hypothetical protein